MEKEIIEIKNILKKIISNSDSKHIAFSGGLDSSIIASHLNGQQKNALVVITDDFISNDLTYSQKDKDLLEKIHSVQLHLRPTT